MSTYFLALLLTSSAAASAQGSPDLTTEQAAIVYDQCLAHAAAQASRTDAAPEAIYGLARTACSQTRAHLTEGRAPDSELVQVLDAIDRERSATFPERTRRIRELMNNHQPGNRSN